MIHDIYSDIALEEACRKQFSVSVVLDEVIAERVTVGVASEATIFRTTNNIHYAYIASQSNLALADVKAIIRNMGAEADTFLPPHGDAEYFRRIGLKKFKAVFPGKHVTSADDTRYYETLAPYSPALVRLSKIKGDIFEYSIERRQWKKLIPYSYSKMNIG
jgi:hypothetical protein